MIINFSREVIEQQQQQIHDTEAVQRIDVSFNNSIEPSLIIEPVMSDGIKTENY